MSLLSTSRFPHLKVVIQIPGLSMVRHSHSIKQKPPRAWTHTKRCYLSLFSRILGRIQKILSADNKVIIVVVVVVVVVMVNSH